MKKRIIIQKKTEERAAHSAQHEGERVFGTAEELLRFDAAQNPPPPKVAERLGHSIRQEPPPPGRSWWGRLFGG